ncbi:MAG: hypothetical protein JKY67_00290 [Pseudomonadales bacterium]|nr:hypothetical protein [Pseudomonadales bacterium]
MKVEFWTSIGFKDEHRVVLDLSALGIDPVKLSEKELKRDVEQAFVEWQSDRLDGGWEMK